MLSYKTPATLLAENEVGAAHLRRAQGKPRELIASVDYIAGAIDKNATVRAKRTPAETPEQFLRRVGYIRD